MKKEPKTDKKVKHEKRNKKGTKNESSILQRSSRARVVFASSGGMKQAPSKKALNIVVGFDCVYKQVRIMRMFGLDYANAVVQDFPYTGHFLSEEFLTQFKQMFEEYFKTLPASSQLACYVVLPDNAVSMDDISLPNMKKKRQQASIESQLQIEYKNYKELQFSCYLAGSNRQYSAYFLTVLRRSYLTNLYRCLAVNKLYPKSASFSANCMIDAILYHKPAFRRRSFILLDVKADYTHVAICVKGKTAGYINFMLGLTHLKNDKVLQENMQYDHDVADLAIINAKERAKMKTLTMEAVPENLSDVADSVTEQLIAANNLNEMPEQKTDTTISDILAETQEQTPQTNALATAVSEIVEEVDSSEADEFDAEQEEEERRERLMNEMMEARKKKVFARKMPKRLPKFMLRPVPETPEGIMYENFRMLVKWALLYNADLKLKEYLPKMECILVNIPSEYAFLIDSANTEEEKSELPLEYLGTLAHENVNGHLDLFGALYTGMYNKGQNF